MHHTHVISDLSGSEPSLNDNKVGVLASEGISPSSDENVLAGYTQTPVRMTCAISYVPRHYGSLLIGSGMLGIRTRDSRK